MDYAVKGWLWIFAGVLLIGIGGVFSTWGWDNINKKGRRHALLFSLAREWVINEAYLLTKPLTFKANDKDIGEKHNPYPRFQTVVLQSILTSDLISDRKLTMLSINYIQYANICNHYFASFDDELGVTKTASQRATRYQDINTNFAPLKRFKSLHNDLKNIFLKEYEKPYKEAVEFADNRAIAKVSNP
jgi:hypothetical protein